VLKASEKGSANVVLGRNLPKSSSQAFGRGRNQQKRFWQAFGPGETSPKVRRKLSPDGDSSKEDFYGFSAGGESF